MTLRGLIQRPWQVRGFLAGRRTQVRVPIRWPLYSLSDGAKRRIFGESDAEEVRDLIANPRRHPCARIRCPLGAPGTVLAIRETWRAGERDQNEGWRAIEYKADGAWQKVRNLPADRLSAAYALPFWGSWRSPATMPLWAARLRYRVLDISAHLVREISEGDARAEGVAFYVSGHGPVSEYELKVEHGLWSSGSYRLGFEAQWDADHGPGSWERDWCFAATVESINQPEESR